VSGWGVKPWARSAPGLLALVGLHATDTQRQLDWGIDKLLGLRVFEDDAGKMNLSIEQAAGGLLVVPTFTVAGDTSKGRRPSFDTAMPPAQAREVFEAWCNTLRTKALSIGVPVEAGVFGAEMEVELVNDGPITLILDSP
jgi:D-aminoacyl-tRNA deacylase